MASWKKIRRGIRRPFEVGAFLLAKSLIPCMPRAAVVSLSKTLASLTFMAPCREKKIGLKNIDAVFGDTISTKDKQRILKTSLATFAQTMLDVFWFSNKPEKRIPEFVSFNESPYNETFFDDKPIICITAHMGSWEIMGQTAALMGADLASIAARIKNPVVDQILIQQRERTGQTIIPQKGALKTLIDRLRKNGKAAFVLDQNTPERAGGIKLEFLGLPMPVSPAPAALAYRTGTEIYLAFCLPEPGGRYRANITEVITPPPFNKELDSDQVAKELTQQILNGISKQIKTYPQFWLWSYKHWRRSPGHEYPDNYPTY